MLGVTAHTCHLLAHPQKLGNFLLAYFIGEATDPGRDIYGRICFDRILIDAYGEYMGERMIYPAHTTFVDFV